MTLNELGIRHIIKDGEDFWEVHHYRDCGEISNTKVFRTILNALSYVTKTVDQLTIKVINSTLIAQPPQGRR